MATTTWAKGSISLDLKEFRSGESGQGEGHEKEKTGLVSR
jgi:hypothetical protein